MLSWIGRLRSGLDFLRPSSSTLTSNAIVSEAEIGEQKATVAKLKTEITTLWGKIEEIEKQMDELKTEDAKKMYRPFGKQYDQRILDKKLEPLRSQQQELLRAVTHYQEILAEADSWLATHAGDRR